MQISEISTYNEKKPKRKFSCFVGIDISKDSFYACAISSPEQILFEEKFSMNIQGFKAFKNRLSSFPKESILIGRESFGCYYINLFAYLSQRGFNCIVLNPIIVKNAFKAEIRKTKTDRTDAFRIAFAMYNTQHRLPEKSFLASEFRDLARERERITRSIARIKNDIEKSLAVLFPELERYVNIYTETILRLLEKFPSAWALKTASLSDIENVIYCTKAGRKPSFSAEKIKTLAEQSIGQFFPVRELLLQRKIKELFFLEEELEFITGLLRTACEEAAMCQDVEILKSIKGIGDIVSMQFIAEVGDIKRFDSHKKLIAYFGVDPTVYESG